MTTAETPSSLKGKTIENVTAYKVDELAGATQDFTLYFTDGTSQNFVAGKTGKYTTVIYLD